VDIAETTQSLPLAQRPELPAEPLFFEFAPAPKLSRRLRKIAPDTAAALRELFHRKERLLLDGDPITTWRFALARNQPARAVAIGHINEKILLSIAADGWCERLGEREWTDYSADARVFAWLLAHSALLEGLGRILREPLMPGSLDEAVLSPADARTNVPLEFSATTPDGRVTKGCVSLSPAMLARLASHPGWRQPAATPQFWLQLAGTLRLELRAIHFRVAELSASEVGDVLILGGRANCWRELHLTIVGARGEARLKEWSACYDGSRLTIIPAVMCSATELIMSESQPLTATPAGVADNIPVSLDFDLGSMSLPLGELAALKPGYVFELPGNLEKLRVVIRANGARIGHGELVAVGDVLGVQLLALEIEGSKSKP
jgi:type III secretion protein Q